MYGYGRSHKYSTYSTYSEYTMIAVFRDELEMNMSYWMVISAFIDIYIVINKS